MSKNDYIIAGCLGIIFGMFGGHHWYMKNYTRATMYILITFIGGLLTCGIAIIVMDIIVIIEGIKLLITGINMKDTQEIQNKNQHQMQNTYQTQYQNQNQYQMQNTCQTQYQNQNQYQMQNIYQTEYQKPYQTPYQNYEKYRYKE